METNIHDEIISKIKGEIEKGKELLKKVEALEPIPVCVDKELQEQIHTELDTICKNILKTHKFGIFRKEFEKFDAKYENTPDTALDKYSKKVYEICQDYMYDVIDEDELDEHLSNIYKNGK